MQLPRGWYQVAGLTPHTFRRHCLSSKSGVLELSFLDPAPSAMSGAEALNLLARTLESQDIHVGAPTKSGHEECAAGIMAYGVYKHVGGQLEYWIIPHEEATVFACWRMGAMATAGLERQDIHQMLKKLFFDHEEEAAAPSEEGMTASGESDVFVVIDDVQTEVETQHEHGHLS